ncbi:hypothetical protein HMPREF0262_02880 [Clostridium sp. ATCC 29733]|nr:hypothetical protein HMPREF0262_02880 [Clostridium sp. ATCC 29733]
MKNLFFAQKTLKKALQWARRWCIIIKRDCTRYALKREVATHLCGFFRGVCPILNRATVNTEHSEKGTAMPVPCR